MQEQNSPTPKKKKNPPPQKKMDKRAEIPKFWVLNRYEILLKNAINEMVVLLPTVQVTSPKHVSRPYMTHIQSYAEFNDRKRYPAAGLKSRCFIPSFFAKVA